MKKEDGMEFSIRYIYRVLGEIGNTAHEFSTKVIEERN